MEKLVDLPVKDDTDYTPEELATLQQYFGGVPPKDEGINWKLLGYISVLFVLLANPWIDDLICKIPKCSNPIIVLVLKFVVFILTFFILYKYVRYFIPTPSE